METQTGLPKRALAQMPGGIVPQNLKEETPESSGYLSLARALRQSYMQAFVSHDEIGVFGMLVALGAWGLMALGAQNRGLGVLGTSPGDPFGISQFFLGFQNTQMEPRCLRSPPKHLRKSKVSSNERT